MGADERDDAVDQLVAPIGAVGPHDVDRQGEEEARTDHWASQRHTSRRDRRQSRASRTISRIEASAWTSGRPQWVGDGRRQRLRAAKPTTLTATFRIKRGTRPRSITYAAISYHHKNRVRRAGPIAHHSTLALVAGSFAVEDFDR